MSKTDRRSGSEEAGPQPLDPNLAGFVEEVRAAMTRMASKGFPDIKTRRRYLRAAEGALDRLASRACTPAIDPISITLDCQRGTLEIAETSTSLSPQELKILDALRAAEGLPLSPEYLRSLLYPGERVQSAKVRVVPVVVSKLRRKLLKLTGRSDLLIRADGGWLLRTGAGPESGPHHRVTWRLKRGTGEARSSSSPKGEQSTGSAGAELPGAPERPITAERLLVALKPFSDLALSVDHIRCLLAVAQQEGACTATIAKKLGAAPDLVTHLVSDLRRDQAGAGEPLLAREVGLGPHNASPIMLTARGQDLLARACALSTGSRFADYEMQELE